MRGLSSQKENRLAASKLFQQPVVGGSMDKEKAIALAEAGLYFSYINAYAQGLSLLETASEEKGYNLNMADIARIWRGGCIIRAGLLEKIRNVFDSEQGLSNHDEVVLLPSFHDPTCLPVSTHPL